MAPPANIFVGDYLCIQKKNPITKNRAIAEMPNIKES